MMPIWNRLGLPTSVGTVMSFLVWILFFRGPDPGMDKLTGYAAPHSLLWWVDILFWGVMAFAITMWWTRKRPSGHTKIHKRYDPHLGRPLHHH